VLAIPFGYFIRRVLKSGLVYQWIFAVIVTAFVILNLFQTWQIKNRILSGDRMTFAYYKKVFGKTEVKPEDEKLLLVNRWLEGNIELKDTSVYRSRLLKAYDFEQPLKKYRTHYQNGNTHSGNYAFRFDSSLLYFNLLEQNFESLTHHDHAWIRVSFYVYINSKEELKDFALVTHFNYKGKAYSYRAMNLNQLFEQHALKAGQRNRLSMDYLTPEVRSKKDVLKIYFWNKGRGEILIDDVYIRLFEPVKQ
jgi:hypothetical protein